MSFYADMQSMAYELLSEFGSPRHIILKKVSDDGFGDPWDPQTQSPDEHTVHGVVLPARQGRVEAFDESVQRETLIDDKRRFVIIAALGTPKPDVQDVLEFDGFNWAIQGVGGSNPGGVPLTYELGVVQSGVAE